MQPRPISLGCSYRVCQGSDTLTHAGHNIFAFALVTGHRRLVHYLRRCLALAAADQDDAARPILKGISFEAVSEESRMSEMMQKRISVVLDNARESRSFFRIYC